MTPEQWMSLLILGGVTGALGQVARVIVGLKKRYDETSFAGRSLTDEFDASKLFVSLVIGFTAGALAAVSIGGADTTFDSEQLLGFAAAGYAGADFIEGIMRRSVPGQAGQAGSGTSSTVPPASKDEAVG